MPPVREKTNGIEYRIHHEVTRHTRPHMHIYYGSFQVAIALDSLEVLTPTRIPGRKLTEALAWIRRHREELLHMWEQRHVPGAIHKIQE